MSNEQQTSAWQGMAQPCVVHSRHDRFTCTRGGHQQIAMVASRSFKRDAFEQMFLERFKQQLNGGQYADGLQIVLVALSGSNCSSPFVYAAGC